MAIRKKQVPYWVFLHSPPIARKPEITGSLKGGNSLFPVIDDETSLL